jgi:hypothetical protein
MAVTQFCWNSNILYGESTNLIKSNWIFYLKLIESDTFIYLRNLYIGLKIDLKAGVKMGVKNH